MKTGILIALAAPLCLLAQTSNPDAEPAPSWRANLSQLPVTPPPNTTAQDVVEFEKNMRMAATYMGKSKPAPNSAQWQANREMVRRMATYLYSLQALSGDRHLRGEVTRVRRFFDTYGFAPYLAYGLVLGQLNAPPPPPDGEPPPQQSAMRQSLPPFDLNAPEPLNPSEQDKSIASELGNRYEMDAARSAAVWSSTETLRQDLEMRGLGLNVEAATAMMRLPQLFRSAAKALRASDWELARTQLQRAEAETGKLAKIVGI